MNINIRHEIYTPTVGDVFYETSGYGDLSIDFEPKEGSIYYLLYAIYGEGDSFTPAIPQYIEFVDLFEKADDALSIRNKMMGVYTDKRLFDYETKVEGYRMPWMRYFGDLFSLEVKPVWMVQQYE